ncbi:MAG TPA: orotidine-5'-phosphate decarboxylase [Dongiaceae bacterium]|nr:orotidine-5'-phosphate decarboxylase [Dongiaceae bacterium]
MSTHINMQNESQASPASSGTALLSAKSIPAVERLIFALDVPTVDEAKHWVELLGESVVFYKLGLQIWMAGGYWELVEWLVARQKQVMVDLKFFDVPETVKLAVKQLQGRGVRFTTVHGNDGILKAAVESQTGVQVLAVTVLTSLDQADLEALGFQCPVEELVLSRARRALELGCAGVISSGLEVPRLRKELGNRFLIVTPGIRPVQNRERPDDQKRTADVEDAFLNGADHIVVGRPIRAAPDPRARAEEFQRRIARLFGSPAA